MSTFNGFFDEIPFISADRFEKDNLESKLFFLSHCHADHMVGLDKCPGLPGPLYTSPISAIFLKKQYPHIGDIKILEIERPIPLEYEVDEKYFHVVVTAFPAHHCPGSIMILFEMQEKNILYTGDMRLTLDDLRQMAALKDKTIDTIYLDSTFLSKNFYEFPTQIESINAICNLIKEWIDKDSNNKVILENPAQYGSEYVFMEIRRKLKYKIYIRQHQIEKYSYIPDMDDCFSQNIEECQVYARLKKNGRYNQQDFIDNNENFRIIKPSALFWSSWKRGRAIVLKEKGEIYRVSCSNHCSCEELKGFLNFFKPKKVKLSVLPNKFKQEMYNLLKEIYTDEEKKPYEHSVRANFRNIFIIPKTSSNITNDDRPMFVTKKSQVMIFYKY